MEPGCMEKPEEGGGDKPGLNCFSFLAYGGILLMLVFGCVRGQISVGAFAAVFSSIDVMFLLMEEIFRDSLGCLSQNLGRVNNFLNLMESPENRQESVEIESGSLTLDDVSFRYPEAETDCLKHISLRIADGETVAVVGENGAGKTTLARILLGIYPADSGSVTIGGKVLNEKTNCFPSVSAVFQKFNRYKLTWKRISAFLIFTAQKAGRKRLMKLTAGGKRICRRMRRRYCPEILTGLICPADSGRRSPSREESIKIQNPSSG